MGGVIGEKVGMGRDGPELDPPESTNPATGLASAEVFVGDAIFLLLELGTMINEGVESTRVCKRSRA